MQGFRRPSAGPGRRTRLADHRVFGTRAAESGGEKGAARMSRQSNKKLELLADLVAATLESAQAVTSNRRRASELAANIIARRFAATERAELVALMRELARLGTEESVATTAYAAAA
jgi:hypothetical protein